MRDTTIIAPGDAADTARRKLITSGRAFHSLLSRFTRAGCLLVAAVGVAVLCGWIFDVPQLTRLLPGLAFMKITTACSLLGASIALWILHTRQPGSSWFYVARVIAALMVTLGCLTLCEHLTGWDLGIDQHIAPSLQSSVHASNFGRVSPATAFILAFLGLALLTLKAQRSTVAASSHWLLVPALLVSALGVLGYVYGADSLYAVRPFTSMAAHTAVSLFVLSLCVLAADTEHGFASVAISDTAGGLVSRRLLPTIPLMIFVLGWVRAEGQALGLYDTQFGSALMVLLSTTFCVIAVAWTAVTLHRVDLIRKLAEAEILSLNAGLELRVQERTRELAQVSAQLKVVNAELELRTQRDELTGLANRRACDTHLAAQVAIAHRYGRSLALVLYDVDSFKAYNDHYGHQAGDECLKRIAGALRSCCRRTADMAARYGGEEFAMILPESGLREAWHIAEAARNAVAQMQIVHADSPTAPNVTISGGIAVLLQDGSRDAEQLFMAADQCLYRAKRLGRNRNVAETPEFVEATG